MPHLIMPMAWTLREYSQAQSTWARPRWALCEMHLACDLSGMHRSWNVPVLDLLVQLSAGHLGAPALGLLPSGYGLCVSGFCPASTRALHCHSICSAGCVSPWCARASSCCPVQVAVSNRARTLPCLTVKECARSPHAPWRTSTQYSKFTVFKAQRS